MSDNNIFYLIQYFRDNLPSIGDFLYALISIIASIYTMTGIASSRILVKLKNWKDREVTRYIILNPINKSDNRTDKIIILCIDLFMVMIPIWILLRLLDICQYWLEYNRFTNNTEGNWLILLSMFTCILCSIFYKTKHQRKLYHFLFTIIYVLLVDTFIFKITIEYSYSCDINTVAVLFFIIFVCNFIIIEFVINVINRIIFNTKYKLKRSKKIEIFKMFWGSLYIGVVELFIVNEELLKLGVIVNITFFLGWIISCYIEIIIINSKKVDFKINKIDDVEITQKAIYQYECDKVKYILSDGCTKVVDSEVIKSIDYTTENIIRRRKKRNVTCFLENNDMLNFDGYNYIKDLWVSFYKLNGNKKEVKIINNKRVKNIVIKNI